MKLPKLLEKKKFLITVEIVPPKGIDIKRVFDSITPLKDKVDFFNVTDMNSAVFRLGSLGLSVLLKKEGYEPIMQITCRDRNRLALQSDLLNASLLGVENFLLLTGDSTSLGDHPTTKPVFDLDSVRLIEVAKKLKEGKDMMGHPLKGKPDYSLGAALNPTIDSVEAEITKLKRKIEAGVEFFQTQPIFNVERFFRFLDKVKEIKVPVIAGVLLLKSVRMAKYLNENIPGIDIPEEVISQLKDASSDEINNVSIDISTDIINRVKQRVCGIHIMSLGWERYIPELLKKVEDRKQSS